MNRRLTKKVLTIVLLAVIAFMVWNTADHDITTSAQAHDPVRLQAERPATIIIVTATPGAPVVAPPPAVTRVGKPRPPQQSSETKGAG